MRRLSIILVLFLLGSGTSWAGGIMIDSYRYASDTYSDILYFWRCEGATLGDDDYSAGDTTGTLNSSAELNTTAAHVGTNGLYVPSGNDYYSFDISNEDIFDATSGSIGFWWYYYTATWADYATLFHVDGATDFYLATYGGSELKVYWDTVSWTTAEASLAVANWYFIEVAYDADTDLMQVRVNGSDVLDSTAKAFSALSSPATLRWGSYNGGYQFYLDNAMISDDATRDLYALRNNTSSPR